MTDRAERGRTAPQNTGRAPRPRAWPSPVRAMTRILNADGSPPTPAPAGPDRSAVVDCALYVDGRRQPGDWTYAEALAAARREEHGFVWIGLHQPELAEMTAIAETYGLHELAVEDAVKAEQRPKLEQFGEVSFLVLRTARYCEHTELTENSEVVETGQVMLFIGPNFLISVRHGDACRLAPVRADLETKQDLLLQGPWAVAYAVTDRVVDLYLEVADQIEDDLDVLEAEVFDRQQQRPDPADLPDEAGAGGVQAGGGAAAAPADDADLAGQPGRAQGDPALLPGRAGPPQPHRRAGQLLRRPAQLDPPGAAGPGHRRPEQRHAQDRRLGGHRRGLDRRSPASTA